MGVDDSNGRDRDLNPGQPAQGRLDGTSPAQGRPRRRPRERAARPARRRARVAARAVGEDQRAVAPAPKEGGTDHRQHVGGIEAPSSRRRRWTSSRPAGDTDRQVPQATPASVADRSVVNPAAWKSSRIARGRRPRAVKRRSRGGGRQRSRRRPGGTGGSGTGGVGGMGTGGSGSGRSGPDRGWDGAPAARPRARSAA